MGKEGKYDLKLADFGQYDEPEPSLPDNDVTIETPSRDVNAMHLSADCCDLTAVYLMSGMLHQVFEFYCLLLGFINKISMFYLSTKRFRDNLCRK